MKVHCKTCNRKFDFHTRRGARLANERCPCGGELARVATAIASNRGRKRVNCAVCGRSVYTPGPAKIIGHAWRYDGYCPSMKNPRANDSGPHQAGTAICWRHTGRIVPIEAAAVLPPAGGYLCRELLRDNGPVLPRLWGVPTEVDLAVVDLDTE